jgi:hypothetical protein
MPSVSGGLSHACAKAHGGGPVVGGASRDLCRQSIGRHPGRSAEWCPPVVEYGVSDPTPSTGLEQVRPLTSPAPKELAAYNPDQNPSCSSRKVWDDLDEESRR